jgi:hypothetical protein
MTCHHTLSRLMIVAVDERSGRDACATSHIGVSRRTDSDPDPPGWEDRAVVRWPAAITSG